jgi:hypothetical protein
MLTERTQSHGRGNETDGCLVQEGRCGFLFAPPAHAQGKPEHHREMPGGPISVNFITILTEQRLCSNLIRGNSDDLPPHLAARETRLSTEFRRIQLSIDVDQRTQRSGSGRSIRLFHSKRFPTAHPTPQQIFDILGKMISGLDGTPLNRRL